MVYFCEMNKTHNEHAFINGKLLQLVINSFQKHAIHCHMSTSHWGELSDNINNDSKVDFSAITVLEPKAKRKIRWVIKIVVECFNVIRVIRRAFKNGVSLVFFSSMSPFANYFTHLWVRLPRYRHIKIIITLHGELQLLRSKNVKQVDRIYAICVRKALQAKFPNRKFLVLNELIKGKLIEDKLIDPSSILEIPHPYDDKYKHAVFNKHQVQEMAFGHIGTAKLAKNSHLFFDLAKQNAESVTSGKAIFLISGQVFPDISPFHNGFVEYISSLTLIDAKKYMEQCLRMRYAVFLYLDDQYEMVSSGAMMDAIAFGIPLISIKNAYSEYLFGLCNTTPGILCESYDDMANHVQRLILNGDAHYAQYLFGIQELQAYFSFERIQDMFDSQMIRS